MRKMLLTAAAATLAVFVFAAAPAQATPASTALNYGHANAGVVQDVARRYRYSRGWYGGGPRYRGYAYRYRPYGYAYRPYAYRPYAYYGYPYYWNRPGVSLWFGF
jgi:hypothetical protein